MKKSVYDRNIVNQVHHPEIIAWKQTSKKYKISKFGRGTLRYSRKKK